MMMMPPPSAHPLGQNAPSANSMTHPHIPGQDFAVAHWLQFCIHWCVIHIAPIWTSCNWHSHQHTIVNCTLLWIGCNKASLLDPCMIHALLHHWQSCSWEASCRSAHTVTPCIAAGLTVTDPALLRQKSRNSIRSCRLLPLKVRDACPAGRQCCHLKAPRRALQQQKAAPNRQLIDRGGGGAEGGLSN